MHILQDCDEVKEFWLAVLNSDQISKIFSLGLEAWLKWNLTDPTVGSLHTSWQTLFGVAVYDLWRDRNSFVFAGESRLGQSILYSSLSQANFIGNLPPRSNIINHTAPIKRWADISWNPPPVGVFKVNVDGSHHRSSGSSACGGLIRDSNGTLIRGFYCKVGSTNAIWAQMWALRLGIKLA